MKASDLLIKALENEGVDQIFALPGEENIDMMESLRNSSIKVITVRHEQSAAFMAAAYGRLTGRPGVCLTTLGPGATNAMTAIAYAYLGGMPCVLITGQKPIKDRVQGSFQVLDIVEMMKPITKESSQVIDANHIATTIRQAFREATSGKPGPVHIEIPEDIASESSNAHCLNINFPPPTVTRKEAIQNVADRISRAQKPLVLISSGAARGEVGDAIKNLVDSQNFYFCSTQMGKGVVDERHERCLGTVAVSSGDYIHEAIEEADLIINIGHDLTEKPPYIMTSESSDVIHIDTTAARMDTVYFAQYELVGCIKTNIEKLIQVLPADRQADDCFARHRDNIQSALFNVEFPVTQPMSAQYLVSTLSNGLDEASILSLDNGLYKIWFARHYVSKNKNNLLLDNALATMGAGLPVAIGAKLVEPEKMVISVCGDGGFMMNCQELETAVRLKLDLIVLVLTDNSYGMIKWKQRNEGKVEFGMDFHSTDLVQFATSFGATGHKLTDPKTLLSVIEKANTEKGVHLIDVPINYSAYIDERIG